MPVEGVPTAGWDSYLGDVIPGVQDKYKGRNRRIKDIRDRRLNLVGPKIPKNFKITATEFRAPLIRQLVRASQSLMAVRMPIPKRIPLTEAPSDQKESSEIEKKLKVVYQRLQRKEDVYGQITDALASDGEATWQLRVNRKGWGDPRGDDEEAKAYNERTQRIRRQNFPLSWEHVASDTYYPLAWDDEGVTEVLVITYREPQPIAHQYGLTPRDGKLVARNGYGPVTTERYPKACRYTEYRNCTHAAIMVDGVVVDTYQHDLGSPDFFHVDFSTNSIKDPTWATESIADPLVRLQDAIENLITIQGNYAFLAGFPVAVLEPVSEEAIPEYDQGTTIKWEPGGTVQPPYGYRWRWADPPRAGSDLTAVREFLMEMSDRVALAPILQGQAEQRMSATTAATLIEVGKSVFGPGLQNLARGYDHMGSRILYLTEKVLRAPLPLWQEGEGKWFELDPDEIDGYYEVVHSLAPVIPMEQMQKTVWLTQGQQIGAVTMRRLREDGYGIEDPDQEDEEVQIEQLEKRPEFQNLLMTQFQRDIQADLGPQMQPQAQSMAAINQALVAIGAALQALQQPQMPTGTPENPPAGMGGPGAPVVEGMGGRPMNVPGGGQIQPPNLGIQQQGQLPPPGPNGQTALPMP